MMKLWLVSQKANNNYDTFDSMVIVAASEEDARLLNPSGKVWPEWENDRYSCWCANPEQATAVYIGETERQAGLVILASFNAG